MATPTLSSVLAKITGLDKPIQKGKQIFETLKNLSPEQRDLIVKVSTRQVDTRLIPKFQDTTLRASTELERIQEPAIPAEKLGLISPRPQILPEEFRQFLREGIAAPLVETPEEKERRRLRTQLRVSGIGKTLQGKTLSEAEKMVEKEEVEKVIASLAPGGPSKGDKFLQRILSRATKAGVPEEKLPELLKRVKQTSPIEVISKKERGFVTSVKKALPEIKVSGQYIPRSTDTLAIKAKNLIKDDIVLAEKIAAGTDDKSIATTAELLKHYDERAALTTDLVIKDALYQKAADLANEKARQLTELGRSVQAASILGRLTPEGQVKFAAREIQRYNEQIARNRGGIFGLQKKIPELTGQQAQEIITEMKNIQSMADGTEKAMRFQKLQQYITDLVPSPLMKKLTTIWKAGLLTGIKTSGLNIFSNISHSASEIVKDIPATIVDKTVSLITGERTVTPTLKGILTGGREGLQKGFQYLTKGFDERNIGTKLDYTRINMGKGKLAKGLQAYTDTVFRVIGSEDQPFYYAAKLRSIYEQVKVAAINKRLKGAKAQSFIDNLVQNPTDDIIRNATFDAETVVFQNKTALGAAAKKIQEIPGGEVIVPFSRTPSAVAMQIINYSPIGIAKTIFENVGKGRFDQRLFSKGIGRALTGTGVLALGSLFAKKGLLTGARPRNEREQKLWELEGRESNSIKIGNKWRRVQILGPLGNVLLIGGIFQKEFSESGSPSEAMAKTLAGASQSFSQQTFLTGVSNFIDAVSDPARSAEYVAASTFASSIPTIISDIARAIDTKERRTNTILEKFQARIPGLREKLEPVITVLGEEKETVGNALEIMADPTRPSFIKLSPLVKELRRLWDLGFKVSPTLLGDKKGYEGLTPQQNTILWKTAGDITNEKITNLIKTPEYQNLADDEKAKYIERFTEKSKVTARVSMIMELTQNLEGEQLKEELSQLKKSGLMTREIYEEYLKLQ